MNTQYDDRAFLPIPAFRDHGLGLIERIVIANMIRPHPYDLWFLDQRTVKRYETEYADNKPDYKKIGWSFFLPVKDCPLDYRELSVWFVLWSLALGTKTKPGKGDIFDQAFCGLEKILGLGHDQAKPICERLSQQDLIEVIPRSFRGWSRFVLYPYYKYATWFVDLAKDGAQSREVPQTVLDKLAERKLGVPAAPQKQIDLDLDTKKVILGKSTCDDDLTDFPEDWKDVYSGAWDDIDKAREIHKSRKEKSRRWQHYKETAPYSDLAIRLNQQLPSTWRGQTSLDAPLNQLKEWWERVKDRAGEPVYHDDDLGYLEAAKARESKAAK